ncbi:MAG: protocatechuate 4,5-dioxygenase subunit alpha [Gammaproteobacteria bacterium]|nr:protocatechuate 4,5-dioxygenase subunit alpha [Gammaproteobacteria bacterium]
MSKTGSFSDIPGTYVMDSRHCRRGYHLNMFCMSLNKEDCRRRFREDETGYLEHFPMTTEQRQAVIGRDWLGLLRLGGNIYYTFKLAIFDGLSMQEVGGLMSGISEAEFQQMMMAGGRQPIVTDRKEEREDR